MWTLEEFATAIVLNSWNSSPGGIPLFKLASKLKNHKLALKNWNKYIFGHIQTSIKDIITHIDSLQGMHLKLIVSWPKRFNTNESLIMCWKKRSSCGGKSLRKDGWRKGCKYSFFSPCNYIIQRRVNSIDHILLNNNTWMSDWEDIGETFLQYYSNLFHSCIFPLDFCNVITLIVRLLLTFLLFKFLLYLDQGCRF